MSKTTTYYPYRKAEKNFVLVHNVLFDIVMPEIKPNSWKVLCFVLRKTRGWQKNSDQLSFAQIREGTGISSNTTVTRAIDELVVKNHLLITKGDKWDAHEYSLNEGFSITESVTESESSVTESVTEKPASSITESVNTKERTTIKEKESQIEINFDLPAHPHNLLEGEWVQLKKDDCLIPAAVIKVTPKKLRVMVKGETGNRLVAPDVVFYQNGGTGLSPVKVGEYKKDSVTLTQNQRAIKDTIIDLMPRAKFSVDDGPTRQKKADAQVIAVRADKAGHKPEDFNRFAKWYRDVKWKDRQAPIITPKIICDNWPLFEEYESGKYKSNSEGQSNHLYDGPNLSPEQIARWKELQQQEGAYS